MRWKNIFLSLFFFLIVFLRGQTQPTNSDTVLYAPSLIAYGRYAFDAQRDMELISSGVHFGFSFSGTICIVHTFINDSSGHNYLQYELDGAYHKQRIKVNGGKINEISIKATN